MSTGVAHDWFALGAAFRPLRSQHETQHTPRALLGADGGELAAWATGAREDYAVLYAYRGTDLAAALALNVGQVVAGVKTEALVLHVATGEAPRLTVRGHQHATAPHLPASASGDYDGYALGLAELLGAAAGPWGVPGAGPWPNATPAAPLAALTLSFAVAHEDLLAADGTPCGGSDRAGRVIAVAAYRGQPTLGLDGWQVARLELGESDGGLPGTRVVASRALAVVWRA